MKKGIEWLDLMSRKEQVMFLKNLVNFTPACLNKEKEDQTIYSYLTTEFENFRDFIDESFAWHETPEGHDWWWDYSKLKIFKQI